MSIPIIPITDTQREFLCDNHGCETWEEYIDQVADNCGLEYSDAYAIFDALGESEAFDGFVTMCEDAASNS